MFDGLQCFLVVVDAGNLSRAARILGVAVSSVSRKIDALEVELGAKLFHRNSRQILLTDAGERFLPSARGIVADLDEAKSALGELDVAPHGLLTVTAPPAFTRRHLAPAVASFLQRYPALQLDLHDSDDIVDLATHRVDVAIRLGVLPDSDLLATALAPYYRLACASPAYLSRHGAPATPQALLQHDCITMVRRQAPAGLWCFAGVNRQQPIAVSGSFRSDNIDTMVAAAIAGAGIVHMASWLVSEAIVAGQLVPLFGPSYRLRGPQLPAIHAVRMPGRSHTAKSQLFIAHLRAHFGTPPYWDRALEGRV